MVARLGEIAPVALSGGSKLNSNPLAGADAIDHGRVVHRGKLATVQPKALG